MTERVARRPDTGGEGKFGGCLLLVGLGVVALVGQQVYLVLVGSNPTLETWSAIFVAIVIQATPFLVLGALLSGLIAVYVPSSVFEKVLPRRTGLAVPIAGAAGVVLPGCECSSVPVAGRLMARGVAPGAALAFLLSAPAINPVVLVTTAVAFPQQPQMVGARLAASLGTSVVMGWVWTYLGRPEWLRIPHRRVLPGGSSWKSFRLTVQHDFLHAGGFLVVGAMAAATLNVALPPSWSQAVAGVPVVSVVVLALLAVLLAVCSEADAFVAASLTGFSTTAKLAFMVVGPAVDVKLAAMQSGTFGRAFALRFAPLTFGVAVVTSLLVGWLLL